MTANLMNCWIDKNHRVTVDQLLGEEKQERPRRRKQKSYAEMDAAEKAAALKAVEDKLLRRREKSVKQAGNPA